jgi:hypothetical protein
MIVILFLILLLVVLIIAYYSPHQRAMPRIMSINPQNAVDAAIVIESAPLKCPPNSFMANDTCWGYWNHMNMPWSNCINPYNPMECSPYCIRVGTLNRTGSIEQKCYPKCGTECTVDSECPIGCPKCTRGICGNLN